MSVKFRIDNDVFLVAPKLSGKNGATAVKQVQEIFDPAAPDIIPQIHAVVNRILRPQSRKRFLARLCDPTNPIDFPQLLNVFLWVLEAQGNRPYPATIGLLSWAFEGGRWHEIQGELSHSGIDILAMPFTRFLDTLYYLAVRRLAGAVEGRNPRQEFDKVFETEVWQVPVNFKEMPSTNRTVDREEVEEGAPDWWTGDEDASQEFIQSMGVQL